MARKDLVQGFADVVSRYDDRDESNSRDLVLADFLVHCLEAYAESQEDTDIWKTRLSVEKIDPWSRVTGFEPDAVKRLLRE